MIEVLRQEHARYRDLKPMWQRYWDFYVGGEQLRRNAGLYLVRRQKEPNDVYAERLSRVFYENYLGSCVDWYAATLFRSHPGISFDTDDPAIKAFYTTFVDDCDRRNTPLLELARRAFIETLVFGESYFLIDFPRHAGRAESRAEEEALGGSRAYLAPFSPLEIVNWKSDSRGDLEWAVLRTERAYQPEFESRDLVVEERWSYYDRERFQVYERLRGPQQAGPGEDEVRLLDEGRHGLAGIGKTPLVWMSVSEGLWLANKSALLAQEHFNKSNALSWALHMGLFAMPVIFSEREWQQIVGEAYYIQLGPEDRFGWTEPEGKVFQIAADNLDRLKDEIYRVCYLMTQAGGREARNLGQSGVSKRRDFAITHEVLRGYGSLVKDFIRRTLELIRAARGDDVKIEVTGMDQFDDPDFQDEVDAAEKLMSLGIESPTFKREVQKRVALKYLEGGSQATKNRILEEIEAQ